MLVRTCLASPSATAPEVVTVKCSLALAGPQQGNPPPVVAPGPCAVWEELHLHMCRLSHWQWVEWAVQRAAAVSRPFSPCAEACLSASQGPAAPLGDMQVALAHACPGS